jgi:hypothetical protein
MRCATWCAARLRRRRRHARERGRGRPSWSVIVLDASAALSALLNAGAARRALADHQLHAPHLIDTGVASGLRRNVQAERLSAAAAWTFCLPAPRNDEVSRLSPAGARVGPARQLVRVRRLLRRAGRALGLRSAHRRRPIDSGARCPVRNQCGARRANLLRTEQRRASGARCMEGRAPGQSPAFAATGNATSTRPTRPGSFRSGRPVERGSGGWSLLVDVGCSTAVIAALEVRRSLKRRPGDGGGHRLIAV